MRPAERDALLMLLAVAAGSADAWSYFGLSHSFVANMTGNTVLIGVGIVRQNGDWRHPLISLCGYAAGVVAGAILTRRVKPESFWSRAVSWALLLEALLMALAEAGWALIRNTNPMAGTERNVLLGVVAFAIGIQSGAMLQMRIPGVVTTYITGTWTNLMSGVARLLSRGTKPATRQVKGMEERAADAGSGSFGILAFSNRRRGSSAVRSSRCGRVAGSCGADGGGLRAAMRCVDASNYDRKKGRDDRSIRPIPGDGSASRFEVEQSDFSSGSGCGPDCVCGAVR